MPNSCRNTQNPDQELLISKYRATLLAGENKPVRMKEMPLNFNNI